MVSLGDRLPMRPALAEALGRIGRLNRRLVILGADGSSLASELLKYDPSRYIDVGIAEQNLVGVAAGLAMGGQVVVVGAMASFLCRRANEQIRNDVCNANLDVTFVGKGGGLSYGAMGPTHHAPEDIVTASMMPNMVVFCPTDFRDAVWAVERAVAYPGPAYVRIGSRNDELVYGVGTTFSEHSGVLLRNGGSTLLVATGASVAEAGRAADILEQKGLCKATVLGITCVKPLPLAQILSLARRAERIITIEETVGGHILGGPIASALAGTWRGSFRSLSLAASYPPAIERHDLFRLYGVDHLQVVRIVADMISV